MSPKPRSSPASRGRSQSKFDRRAARNRVVILVMAVLMGLSLLAIPLGLLLSAGTSA